MPANGTLTISAAQVQKLREASGAGLMDCKRALEEASGDFEKSIQILREKGKASAAKKAGRSTGQGLVCARISPDGKKGSLAELSCETDFVARTKDFQDLLQSVAKLACEKNISSKDALLKEKIGSETVEAALKGSIGKLGENMGIKKLAALGGGSESGVECYVHAPLESSPQCGSLGVVLEYQAKINSPELKALAKELCMQVAAANPRWISKENVPADVVSKEKEIYKEQCRQSGKPEKAWDKIMEGKLNDFFRQFCLLEQYHIRDSSGKTPVSLLIKQAADKVGTAFAVRGYARFKMGEE